MKHVPKQGLFVLTRMTIGVPLMATHIIPAIWEHTTSVTRLQLTDNWIWIDYQMSTWDDHVDRVVAGLKTRGMGFAIMVDSATFPDVMITTAPKVVNWTQEPHYYRHQGLPIVPIWNNEETIFSPLPINAIYISRIELVPPEWASDTYTWVSDTYLERLGSCEIACESQN